MKRAVFLPCFLLLTCFASARTIPLQRGGSFPLPDQAVVSADGITFVRPGDTKPMTLKWQDIDLQRLAKQNIDLEGSRQKALLTGEKTVLAADAPTANPYAEFLAVPVKVSFRPKETHQSRTEYNSVTGIVPQVIDPATGLVASQPGGFFDRGNGRTISVAPIVIVNGVPTGGQVPLMQPQAVTNTTSTRSDTTVNMTRPALDTTAAGFLELISDDSTGSSAPLIRELREHPHVFTNLIAALRELQTQTPDDSAPGKAIESLQLLSRNGAISIEAQRFLGRFVRHVQTRAGVR
jgi:hypothetical protein